MSDDFPSAESRAQVAELLAGTSRTFALTIPMLNQPLQHAVGLAYLVLRVGDTVEDAAAVPADRRVRLLHALVTALEGEEGAETTPMSARLIELTRQELVPDPAERSLLHEWPLLIDELASLPAGWGQAIRHHSARVLRRMAGWVQKHDGQGCLGLNSLGELDDYMYSVAGIVGELVTDLAVLSEPRLAEKGQDLLLASLAPDFGAGLQLTNILKDSAGDLAEGRSYLPPSFRLDSGRSFLDVLRPLVGTARSRLARGVEYVLVLPSDVTGLRMFCLVALVLAAASLRELLARSDELFGGVPVKIRRDLVMELVAKCQEAAGDDDKIVALWSSVCDGLPEPRVR